jgi:hypothetical protein
MCSSCATITSLYHHVVVVALAALAAMLVGDVGAQMHRGGVVPKEERLVLVMALVDEGERMFGHLVVDGLHALLGQRTGVLDGLAALAVGAAVQHAARAEALLEFRVLRVVRVFRFLLGIEVVQAAEEFIEAVHRGQELVAVAQVVLAELAGGIAVRLEHLGDRRIFLLQADIGAGHANLGQTRANGVLPGDECRTTRGAALLSIIVSKGDAFLGDAVDVRGAIAHLATAVEADVPPAHVVAPENQDIGFLRCHGFFLGVNEVPDHLEEFS